MTKVSIVAVAALALIIPASAGAQTPTLPYDHIHLLVPDPAVASAWYEKHFGGTRITEAPDRLMFGSTRLMFIRNATAKPSAGSAIDHIGFSFTDLDAKMKEFEAAGLKITTPMRDVPGLFKLAFLEDPWGARIEVVQDRGAPRAASRPPARPEPRRGVHVAARQVRRQAAAAQGTHRRGALRPRRLQQHVDPGAPRAKRSQARAARSITSAGDPPGRSPTPSTRCAQRKWKSRRKCVR